MFRNRRTSQKPDEELYAAFKQSFPEVGSGSGSAELGQGQEPEQRSTALNEAVNDGALDQRSFDHSDDVKDHDSSPKPYQDNWRLTPSLMDPNSFAFTAFANQLPGYYTPTPGGFGTLYHSQAGDLHTPGMGMNTPLSMPHSVHGIHAQDPSIHLQHFNPHLLHQHEQQHHHHHNPHHAFQDPFAEHHQQQHQHHQQQQQYQQQQDNSQSFPPTHLLQHQDSGYVAMDDSSNKTTPTQIEMSMTAPKLSHRMPQTMTGSMAMPGMQSGEKFRFHTTLNAPTAMIRHSDEIPITYLNKGQAYTMSIFDTHAPLPQSNVPVKYRTYVRVSFEDEQQRARPGACWQLWKEGRGSNEAHQRGGKLLAVEYVDPNQGGDDELRKSQIQLEKASFDGFAVTWVPNSIGGGPDCAVSVRFNFLSTDFSHSKGVKGIPVRLCAKTELISAHPSASNEPEVCFSKVKLFRDHGAERKLSNDVAHVKKTIEKLKQQITQAESGMGNMGKRKRSGSISKGQASRPGKLMKHKRTWSVDSDADIGRLSTEEDLHMKLVNMQDMFSSTRPVSILYLRGEATDDPDLHPVQLAGEGLGTIPLARATTWESKPSVSDSPASNTGSSASSAGSQITPKRKFSEIQQTPGQEAESEETSDTAGYQHSLPSPRPIKVPKLAHDSTVKPDLLAVDIDHNYQPPLERPIKPVACFYVRQKDAPQEYYRAIYLMQRTVRDLVNRISDKFEIDPTRVTQVTHVNTKGLRIVVDEDVVRELPEGQDMIVECAPLHSDRPIKHEFLSLAPGELMVDGEIESLDMSISDPLEMWLNY